MNSKLKTRILIMLLCTVFTALGQLFFKYSAPSFKWDLLSLLTNYNLFLGFFFYSLGALLLILALKFGNLSSVYPLVALTFIWVMLVSFLFLGETINGFKIGAVIFIIFGVVLITSGSKNEN